MKHIFITFCIITTTLCSNAQIITTIAGNGIAGYSGDGGQATAAELHIPWGIAIDAYTNVYIGDSNRVRKINSSGIITTIAGNGTPGFSGDGGPATAAQLHSNSVSVDALGNVYISDYGNQRIRIVNTSGIISTIAGNGTAGFSGDGGPATNAEINAPTSVAIDIAGNVYISDELNNRIRKVNTSGVISTVAGNGIAGYSGDGGPATAAELNSQEVVAVDAEGNMFIADTYNNRIRKVNTSGIISTVAGNGIVGFVGDGGAATAAELSAPTAIAVDLAGNIYITDQHNQRIRTVNTLGIITTIAGIGVAGYSGDGCLATAAEINDPEAIAIDTSGNVLFADTDNNRVRKISPISINILGITNVCAGSTIILSDVITGGTWSSSSISIATVGTSTGIVTGVYAGIVTINYTLPSGCTTSRIITVNPLPAVSSISGPTIAYLGSSISLSDATAGGIWTSTNSSIATIGSTGFVTLTSQGIDTIEYTVTNTCGSTIVTHPIAVSAALPCYVSPSNLVSWYPFTGNDLDSSGNGNNLTNSGAILTNDRFGNANRAYYFNGSSMLQILLPNAFMPSSSNYYSTSFWFEKSNNSEGVIWQCTDDPISNISNYDVISNHSGCDGKTMAVQDYPFYNPSACSPDTFAINLWYNIIIIFNQVADSFSLYRNGVFFFSGPLGNISPAHGLLTFGNNTNETIGFTGAIDDIGIWSRALTPCEILQLYSASCSITAGTISGTSSVSVGLTTQLTDATIGGVWTATNGNATVGSTGIVAGVYVGLDTINYTVSYACGSITTSYIVTVTVPVPNTPCYVPSSGLVSWYPFTGNANDSSGYGNNGTVYGATLTTDRFGNANSAYSFNGISNYIKSNSEPGYQSDTFSVSFWASYNTDFAYSNIISYGDTLFDGERWGVIDGYDYLRCSVGRGCGGTGSLFSYTTNFGWHMITYVVKGVNQFTYYDGAYVGTETNSLPSSLSCATTNLWFGADPWTTMAYYNGKLDDIGIWSRSLNACEITQLYHASCSPVSAGTITGTTYSICNGSSIVLADTTPGGSWSSSNTGIATVGSTGIVTALSGGVTTISYTVSNACGSATATYVATVNSTVTNAIINTIAGDGTVGFGGNGGAATLAMLSTPTGVALDNSGNLYIADFGNNQIRKVNSSGIITTISGNTTGGYSGDGGAATSAELNEPYGVAIDNSGNIYVSDVLNSRIRKINTAGIITTIAGNGTIGYGGDGGPATAAEFNNPNQMAIDDTGNILVADFANNRIRKISISGSIYTIAGNGIAGYSSDGILAISAELNHPSGVAVDAVGNIYIADGQNNRIRKVSTAGYISTIAGTGTASFGGDNGAATAATLNNPSSIAVDASGNIYITDQNNQRLRMINTAGIITTVAGNGVDGYAGDGGNALSAEIAYPYDVAISSSGKLYIADNANQRIRIVYDSVSAAPITGSSSMCSGSTISLSDTTSGGNWSSSNTYVATISSSGSVTGLSPGTALISYTITNACGSGAVTKVVTINPMPSTISGSSSVCVGSNTTLTDLSIGGIWSSSSPVATIGSASGTVNGVSPGSTTITYTLPTGCYATTNIAVIPMPNAGTITGISSLCPGGTIVLSDASTGGVWTASNSNAIVSSGYVTGVTAGTDTIKYTVTNTCGFAIASKLVTINPMPSAGTILGSSSVCTSTATILTDAILGGVWGTTNGTASISGSGVVTGVSIGVDTIEYIVTNSCGTAVASKIVTVNASPSAGTIAGSTSVCAGSNITLSDAISGGTWSSSNTGIAAIGSTGVVTGVAGGTAIISYAITNGCGTATATKLINVNSLPNAGTISGSSSLCTGANITLTEGSSGGSWTASNGIAIVTSTGIVYGFTAGVDTITYAVSNGCGTALATKTVTVNPTPNAGTITGASSVCHGNTINLTDLSFGGLWSSSNTVAATIGSTGIVAGATSGTTTISYAVTNGCGSSYATYVVTVLPLPNAGIITGLSSVCVGSNIALSDATVGGSWAATNATADITSTGVVTGLIPGIDTIKYIVSNSCGVASATTVITINPLPSSGIITGSSVVCVGSNISLTDAATGGVWTATNANATVGSSGSVTGISSGIDTIKYSVSNSCGTAIASAIITINPLPNAGSISGSATVCVGSEIGLSDASIGGSWTSSNSNATVSSIGDVYGLVSGVDTIYYHTSNSCGSAMTSKTVTINPLPNAGSISGSSEVCVSSSIVLTDMSAGGIWSITNANASIGSTGIVTGLVSGFDTVRYTVLNSCGSDTAIRVITVNTIPSAGTITGVATVCTGSSIALTDAVVGGIWISSNSHGIVSSLGMVTGMTGGLDTIKYIVTNACGSSFASKIVTINASPNAGSISGPSSVCVDAYVTLTDLSPGGVWSSTNGNATIVTGTVSGVSSGSDTIKYTVSNICGTVAAEFEIVVEPLPHSGTITGLDTLCAGISIMLSDTAAGGIWSSVTGAATVSSIGLVTGLHSGVDTVRYTVTNSCGSAIAKKPIFVRQAGDCTTAVDLSSGATDISVIPNPNKGLFTVKGTFAGMSDNVVTIEVSSMLGQTVYKKQLVLQDGIINESIHLSNDIANGMYLLSVTSENDVRVFHIVIEQ